MLFYGCIRKLRQLTCCLTASWGNDLAGSVFAWRHLKKLISDRLLRQCNILMIYNKIERVLVITKQIFNYYNSNFSLEITSKVQKVNQKYTFTQTNTKCNFQTPSLFFLAQQSRNGTHRIVGYQMQRRIHLRRQHFSVFGCSLWPFLKRKDASSVGHICRLHTSSSLFYFS